MSDGTDFNRAGAFFSPGPLGDGASLPIARRHLHDELLERLRDLIVGCELRPDAKIPEKELCERFGVSRTPLREALKVLAYEGLVVLQPNRGASVSPLTIPDLDELFPIYSRLEALAGELACRNCLDSEIADIRLLHEEMVEQYRQRVRKRYFELNEAIHERIHMGGRNQTLSGMLRSIAARIRRARIYANATEERWADAIREHEQILAALEAREGPRLAELLRTHMENTFDGIKQALGEQARSRNADA
jgi:DNA-binding GntR family transcriptional regulator